MPGEPGELEAMSYAFRGCTGLQHEVIAMASCCKKGGDSPSRETITAKPLELLASRSLGVIGLWWPVLISGLLVRAPALPVTLS
ncbi:hypothetical protein [Escherichia marmotae]|uniref:hypothetical protein n=1 Tax=Escherichia marmotae TaxID=1499973 RepID=UPI002ACACCF0|nr:hypothetical protein [Escherichia marmotae]MDZ5517738.1 hypothetical protein [Escherichia marmotae]